MSVVLVTGGTGFIARYCIVQLLEAGHEVRTTVRKLSRADEVRAQVKGDSSRLTFFEADLERDAGWAEATKGSDYVLHVASPLPNTIPKDENELIVPAREGTLRALRAARDAGVKRVVLTSSIAAIAYGHPGRTEFDETVWTNLEGRDVQPYIKSKAVAERAAWDFIEKEGNGLELATVNPALVAGPVMSDDFSTSVVLVKRMIEGKMPGLPKISFGVVDVRDVADLHVRAMEDPAAKNQRFLCVSGEFLSLKEMADTLRSSLGEKGRKIPSMQVPDFMLRLVSLWDGEARQTLPELGQKKRASNAKARELLGWNPRAPRDAIIATAESLIALGISKI